MVIVNVSLYSLLFVAYAVLIFKLFFVKDHREESVKEHDEPAIQLQKDIVESIVGVSKYKPLKPPPPKPKKVVPIEEIDTTFENIEFEQEHFPEPKPSTDLPEDVKGEVVTVVKRGKSRESDELSKKICVDYEQIYNATRKIINGESINIEDATTLSTLERTNIDDQIFEAIPHYLYIVQQALSK